MLGWARAGVLRRAHVLGWPRLDLPTRTVAEGAVGWASFLGDATPSQLSEALEKLESALEDRSRQKPATRSQPRIPPTETSQLALPERFRDKLREPRSVRIDEHEGHGINVTWWNEQLERRGLRGGPVHAHDGATSGRDATISRSDVFALADGARVDPDEALRLLWHALAWGSGPALRHSRRRLDAAARVPSLGRSLMRIADLPRADVEGAYDAVSPSRLLPHLGPSFGTKYLYFAGGGIPQHPWLILDRRVALSLRDECGWASLGTSGWPGWTYRRYCELLARWAHEESARLQRQVGADEVERALFDR